MDTLTEIAERVRSLDAYEPHWFANRHSGGVFHVYPYIRVLGELIADAVARGRGRIVVNMPPRVGKSHFVSEWVPPWYFSIKPAGRVMLCSYGSELATDFGRRVRNTCRDLPGMPETCRPSEDSSAVDRWHNRGGGGMVCTGVGGSITGRGFDFGAVDDPYKNWQDAWSSAVRRRTWDWFVSTFLTRADPGAVMVVIQTRWHAQDLSGRIERGDAGPGWRVIKLPMLAETGDALGRAEGEPLCPSRYDADACEDIRRSVGESVWQAVYQQRPDLAAGGLVYTNFAESMVQDVPADRALPLCLTLDFNINPGMHGLIVQYDPMKDRFNVMDEIHRARMDLIECVREFCRRSKTMLHSGEFQVFGDATGTAEAIANSYSQYAVVQQVFNSEGMRCRLRIPKANPRRIDRVNAMMDCLKDTKGKQHMVISPRCKRLHADFREVQKDDEGMPDESETLLCHASSALGYMVEYLRPVGGRVTIPTTGRVLV